MRDKAISIIGRGNPRPKFLIKFVFPNCFSCLLSVDLVIFEFMVNARIGGDSVDIEAFKLYDKEKSGVVRRVGDDGFSGI